MLAQTVQRSVVRSPAWRHFRLSHSKVERNIMLSEKAQHILQVLLLNQGSFLTVKTLSSMLGMSERTVNTYLKEVAGFCEKEGVTYVSRRGTGIRLELTRKTEMLLTGFIGQKTLSYDDQERQNYICRVLLEGWENYTAALFAGELYVSR